MEPVTALHELAQNIPKFVKVCGSSSQILNQNELQKLVPIPAGYGPSVIMKSLSVYSEAFFADSHIP